MGCVYVDRRSGRPIHGIRYTDVDGREKWERTNAATKALARRILAERENAVERAKLMKLATVRELIDPKPAVTLRSFALDEYMDHVKAHGSEDRVYINEHILRANILPKLGDMALGEINAGHLQKYADTRLGKRKPSTVRGELMVISAIYREAIKRELVDRNPVKLVKKPTVDNVIVRYLDANEEEKLLAHAVEPLKSAIVVSIHSGLRESELANLTWADVRFGEAAADSFIVVRHTKSKRDRVVPMSGTLYATLQRVPRFDLASPYVFTNPDTKTKYERFNNTPWRRLVKDSGIARFRWHDLRHTFGSRLAQAGESIIAIKELMGHSSITVTMRYAHLAPSNLRAAVRALDPKPATKRATKAKATPKSAPGVVTGVVKAKTAKVG